MIIGLHGLARSGKDTTALFLKKHFGFAQESFARSLYEEVSESFNVPVSYLESDDWKRNPKHTLCYANSSDADFLSLMKSLNEDPDALYAARTSRQIVQDWANLYRKRNNPLYFTDKVHERLMHTSEKNIVVSDVRFEYEAAYLLAQRAQHRVYIIEITRPGTVRSDNISDQRLPDHLIDFTLHNISSLSQLKTHAVQLIKGLEWNLNPLTN